MKTKIRNKKEEKVLREKRILSAGIIFNMILAIFAFAFIISVIYAEEVEGIETVTMDAGDGGGGDVNSEEIVDDEGPIFGDDLDYDYESIDEIIDFEEKNYEQYIADLNRIEKANQANWDAFFASEKKEAELKSFFDSLNAQPNPSGAIVPPEAPPNLPDSVAQYSKPIVPLTAEQYDATKKYYEAVKSGNSDAIKAGKANYDEVVKGVVPGAKDIDDAYQRYLDNPTPENQKAFEDMLKTSAAGGADKLADVPTVLKKTLSQTPGNYFLGNMWEGIVWAAGAATFIQLFGTLLGLQTAQTNALTLAAMGGIFVGKTMWGLYQSGKAPGFIGGGKMGTAEFGLNAPSIVSVGLGIVVGLIILNALWKEEKVEKVEFECLPWEAPTGGKYCQDCNKDPFRPCTEYRCKSLGQACELVNAGTKNETCIWNNPRDVDSPIITTNSTYLTNGYKYNPAVVIRPAKRGVAIERIGEDKCIKAFTPITFGFSTNEPAKCKIDYNNSIDMKFDDMTYDFGETSLYLYEHVQRLALPGPKNLEEAGLSPELTNGGEYSLFVKCQDKNGNYNEDAFSFKFCVEKGPDTTPADMITTSYGKEAPFTYNLSSIPVSLYVNEPADCRWDRDDKTYDSMQYNMTCMQNLEDMTPDLNYICQSTLTGLKNNVDNKFYFRCKDQPYAEENNRNKNSQSFVLNLKGTRPLTIYSISPNNETVKGFGDTIQVNLEVETRAGYNDEAFCYFSQTSNENDYILFADTESRISKQRLDLTSGSYTYHIKCVDLGGNSVYQTISFKVESDNLPPRVVRAYKTNEQLSITTDEKSTCTYSISSCNFEIDEGIQMPNDDSEEHSIAWDVSKRYFIKCKDQYENMPAPTECNTIVKGFNAG